MAMTQQAAFQALQVAVDQLELQFQECVQAPYSRLQDSALLLDNCKRLNHAKDELAEAIMQDTSPLSSEDRETARHLRPIDTPCAYLLGRNSEAVTSILQTMLDEPVVLDGMIPMYNYPTWTEREIYLNVFAPFRNIYRCRLPDDSVRYVKLLDMLAPQPLVGTNVFPGDHIPFSGLGALPRSEPEEPKPAQAKSEKITPEQRRVGLQNWNHCEGSFALLRLNPNGRFAQRIETLHLFAFHDRYLLGTDRYFTEVVLCLHGDPSVVLESPLVQKFWNLDYDEANLATDPPDTEKMYKQLELIRTLRQPGYVSPFETLRPLSDAIATLWDEHSLEHRAMLRIHACLRPFAN